MYFTMTVQHISYSGPHYVCTVCWHGHAAQAEALRFGKAPSVRANTCCTSTSLVHDLSAGVHSYTQGVHVTQLHQPT